MKKELLNHGPESCAVNRGVAREVLTGGSADPLLISEITLPGCRPSGP